MQSDFTIIGGGMVGAAIGYGLAKAGKAVLILDQGDGILIRTRSW